MRFEFSGCAGGLQAGFTSYSKWLNGLRLDSQWEARLFQISFLPRAWFSSSLKHDFAPAAYTRWAECSLGWLGSRPAQMGARGPHNLWSQVQFQAALETEGKIFKVKFSPQRWKGWMKSWLIVIRKSSTVGTGGRYSSVVMIQYRVGLD